MQVHQWVAAVGVFVALCSGTQFALAKKEPVEFPKEVRGVWYENTDAGLKACQVHTKRGAMEPLPGGLLVSENQARHTLEDAPNTIYFLIRVLPFGKDTWQMQALRDPFPYETAKELQTIGLTLLDKRLYWAVIDVQDGVNKSRTSSYVRCL